MVWNRRFIHVDLGVNFLRSDETEETGKRTKKEESAVPWMSYKVPPTYRLYNVRHKGNWQSLLHENQESLLIIKYL